MSTPPDHDHRGVEFAKTDGRRSTTAVGKAVLHAALSSVDPVGADAATSETSWRQGYVPHFKRLVQAGLQSSDAAVQIARAGLAEVGRQMVFVDGDVEHPLHTISDENAPQVAGGGPEFTSEVIRGAGAATKELAIPYKGALLTGDALRRQVDAWVDEGIAEPGIVRIIDDVLANPDWLAVPGRQVVLCGASAEMGPLRSLLRWGAHVAAIDLPRPQMWADLAHQARRFAGSMTLPSRAAAVELSARAGADILCDAPALIRWVEQLPYDLVIGNYVYADGRTNVQLNAAVDLITSTVMARRPGTIPAALATPTDVFVVPDEAVKASSDNYDNAPFRRFIRTPLKALSGGRLLRRNYVAGASPGINDSVVTQQGPNYLLAKRLCRWRSTVTAADGARTSMTVAPPTRTRSVVKNSALAAAYAGAHRFGIEVFEPATASTLMAACLVHDIHADTAPVAHPWQLESAGAVHGGLWRSPYDPRSALGLAALLGVTGRR